MLLRKNLFRPLIVRRHFMMASTSTAAALTEEAQSTPRLLPSPQRRHRQGVILLACGCFNPPTFMHLRMFELARDHLHRRTNYRVIEGVISVVNDAYQKKDLVSATHRLAMVRLAVENSKWIRVDDWESLQTQWCPTVTVLRHVRDATQQPELLQQPEKLWTQSLSVDDETGPVPGPSPFKKPKKDWPTAQSSTESSGVGSTISDHQLPQPSPSVVPKSASIDVASIGMAQSTLTVEEKSVKVMLLCGSDLLESFGIPNSWAPEDMEEIVRDFGIVVVTRAGYDPRKFVYESDLLTRYENNIHYVTEWIANDISSTKIRRALNRAESVRYLVADRVLDYIYQHRLYGCPKRYYDILSSPSSLLETIRETTSNDREQPHCSYHPQYKRFKRKSVTDESDYDNLAPCPCPLTSSASVPNAFSAHLLRPSHFSRTSSPSAFVRPIDYRKPIEKALSLDVPNYDGHPVSAKPTKFPTDLEAALHISKMDAPTVNAIRTTARTTIMKSALKSPTTAVGTRQRAVSYHNDLSRSTTSRPQALPSSRTIDMTESNVISEEQLSSMPFGSVTQRSLSNLSDLQLGSEYGTQARNGKVMDASPSGPTATIPKTSAQGAVGTSASDTEEVTWHYNPELTKSLPNLRLQRQTPPRHVRIMDKGVCFSSEDRESVKERTDEVDESAPNLVNNLVVKVKQLKLTMSPETTV